MASVTARIREVKQPRGGYIKPSQFEEIVYIDRVELGKENLHASIIGMTVDYLTRYLMSGDVNDAFKISILGYSSRTIRLGKEIIKKDRKKKIDIVSLINQITGLDDESIISASKACTYDVWYRAPDCAMTVKGAEETIPDMETIKNIRTMVRRSLKFWEEYGPITVDGFTFEPNGYTQVISCGDGDYLTADTLWDFKVSKSKPRSRDTLQILVYWIMGLHSGKGEYAGIKKLGIFNPRLNLVYLLNTDTIPLEVIKEVEEKVICY